MTTRGIHCSPINDFYPTPNPTTVPFNLDLIPGEYIEPTFTGPAVSCNAGPYSSQKRFCDFLCAGSDSDACIATFNTKMAGSNTTGLNCTHYKHDFAAGNGTMAQAGARRWFCDSLVPANATADPNEFANVNMSTFPIAGAGTPTVPSKVKSFSNVSAHSCATYAAGRTCVLLAPGVAVFNDTAYRVSAAQCSVLNNYLNATYVSYLKTLYSGTYRGQVLQACYEEYGGPGTSLCYWDLPQPWFPYSGSNKPHDMAWRVETPLYGRGLRSRRNMRFATEETLAARQMTPRDDVAEFNQTCIDLPECPIRDCTLLEVEPAICDRYPPIGTDIPCTPRNNICTKVQEDYCQTAYAPYEVSSDDPTHDWELLGGAEDVDLRTLPLMTGGEALTTKAQQIRKLLSDLAEASRERRRSRGGEYEMDGLVRAENTLIMYLEAAACAAKTKAGAACARLGLAADGASSVRSRSLHEGYRTAKTIWQWLPPVGSVDRSCYAICGYDWAESARTSCLYQADGFENGTVYSFFVAAQATLRDVCEIGSVGDGKDLLKNLSSLLPDLGLIHIETAKQQRLVQYGIIAPTIVRPSTSRLTLALKKLESVVVKLISKLTGTSSSNGTATTLSTETMLYTFGAKLFGYNDTDKFKADAKKWFRNTNLYPDDGSVGAAYYALLPTPFGEKCGLLNGTALKIPYIDLPIWLPTWLPGLPTWPLNYLGKVFGKIANTTYIVPGSMVVDAGGCSNDTQDFCVPLTGGGCPCSPTFASCEDTVGLTSTADVFAFFIDVIYPSAPNSSVIKLVAKVTGMSTAIVKYANVTKRSDFSDYLFCFIIVGIPSISWIILVIPYLGIIIGLALATVFAAVGFLTTVGWLMITLVLFNVVEYDVVE